MKSFYAGKTPVNTCYFNGVKYKLKKSIKNGKYCITLIRVNIDKDKNNK